MTLLALNEPETALVALEDWQDDETRAQGMALAMFDLGRLEESADYMDRLLKEWPQEYYIIAEGYAWMGDADAAFEALEKYVADTPHEFWGVFQRTLYRRIHSDPRWQAMLEKYGVTPQQLAEIPFKIKTP